MNKIEQLIEKWKLKQEDLHNVGCPIDGYYIYVAEIIKDLQSLQDTTEEREIEIKEVGENQMTFTNVFDCPKCGGHIYGGSTVNYCSNCGAKIKRID